MRNTTLVLSSLLAVNLLGACGSEDPPLDPAATYQQLVQQFCEDAHRCSADGSSQFDPLLHGSTVEECVEIWEGIYGTPAEIAASVEAGRIDFVEGWAEVCLDERQQLACGNYWGGASEDPYCAIAFWAEVPVGGQCELNTDCMGGFPECLNGECVDHDDE